MREDFLSFLKTDSVPIVLPQSLALAGIEVESHRV
jgi:hypothetical protein